MSVELMDDKQSGLPVEELDEDLIENDVANTDPAKKKKKKKKKPTSAPADTNGESTHIDVGEVKQLSKTLDAVKLGKEQTQYFGGLTK